MKRHDSLAPLSREHHPALILAQLMKRDAPVYKGLPTGDHEKIVYAMNMFRDSLKEHFHKEEILIGKIQHCHEGIQKTGQEIIAEHRQLTEAFMMLDKATYPATAMDSLGNALDIHIRKEERILFPLIQEHCSEPVLMEIAFLLA